MEATIILKRLSWPVLAALVIGLCGCDKSDTKSNGPPAQSPAVAKPAPATQPLVPVVQAMDWCREHGVPESICAQCKPELAAACKGKGDWCKEHNVPASQCFKCHPELKDKFASAFKAKYGKEPPAAE